ncbi:MAG: low molecular weight protein-tyrosine-phosphatase, partial [Pseudomonadota bacterium]
CVCTGNICRSPTAEAVLRQKFSTAGLTDQVTIDSAGTHGYHIGDAPDPRSQAAGQARGYDFRGQQARKLTAGDYDHFDLILAMDAGHLSMMEAAKPANSRARLAMMRAFGPPHTCGSDQAADVPDPYYGGTQGFDHVLDLIEQAADGLVRDVASQLKNH